MLDEPGRGLVMLKVGVLTVRTSSGTITDVLQYGHLIVVMSSPGEPSAAPQFGQVKDCAAISANPFPSKEMDNNGMFYCNYSQYTTFCAFLHE
jgi:hypothetical protein